MHAVDTDEEHCNYTSSAASPTSHTHQTSLACLGPATLEQGAMSYS